MAVKADLLSRVVPDSASVKLALFEGQGGDGAGTGREELGLQICHRSSNGLPRPGRSVDDGINFFLRKILPTRL
jgi:hypothetical protein